MGSTRVWGAEPSSLPDGGGSNGAVFEGAGSDSVDFVLFFLIRGFGEGSSSTSSLIDRIAVATGCDEAGLFEEEAAFILFNATQGADFYGEEVPPPPTAAEDAPAADLDFFGANLYVRSWFGSNSVRVKIHPYVTRLSSMRTRTSLYSSV